MCNCQCLVYISSTGISGKKQLIESEKQVCIGDFCQYAIRKIGILEDETINRLRGKILEMWFLKMEGGWICLRII
jgi:hypothetical protein